MQLQHRVAHCGNVHNVRSHCTADATRGAEPQPERTACAHETQKRTVFREQRRDELRQSIARVVLLLQVVAHVAHRRASERQAVHTHLRADRGRLHRYRLVFRQLYLSRTNTHAAGVTGTGGRAGLQAGPPEFASLGWAANARAKQAWRAYAVSHSKRGRCDVFSTADVISPFGVCLIGPGSHRSPRGARRWRTHAKWRKQTHTQRQESRPKSATATTETCRRPSARAN